MLIKGVPGQPPLRSTQSLQAKSCRSSHSLLAGEVAGAVLLLLVARKAFAFALARSTIA